MCKMYLLFFSNISYHNKCSVPEKFVHDSQTSMGMPKNAIG